MTTAKHAIDLGSTPHRLDSGTIALTHNEPPVPTGISETGDKRPLQETAANLTQQYKSSPPATMGMKVTKYADGKMAIEVEKLWSPGWGVASTYIGMARVAKISPDVLLRELVTSGAYRSAIQVKKYFKIHTRILLKSKNIEAISVGGKIYKPGGESTPTLPSHLSFYPGRTADPTEIVLGMNAEIREEQGRTVAEGILSLEDVFTILDKILTTYKQYTGIERVPPFLTELVVYGHGEPGKFKFGRQKYGIAEFKKMEAGLAKIYLKQDARVKLDGCDVALFEEGKEFLCEVGRVFFGKKIGRVWGNTGKVFGDLVPHNPKEYAWPKDCK